MPKKVMNAMKIHFVENMDDVLKAALIRGIPSADEKQINVRTEMSEQKAKGEESQDPPVRH
jgi:hypothetical protein